MKQQDIDDLKKEYEKYRFQCLEQISDEIWLSWDKETGRLCRCRSISEEQKEVYSCLSELGCSHLPDIIYIGSGFVAEEYISGVSLKEKFENETLAVKEFKNLLKQLLNVVQQLHQNGIIHRDIKASNIMADGHGKYYLVDFDIAIKQGADIEIAGTAGYAPPEQYGYQDCDARSDIYSIGVLQNMLLTGHAPKEGLAKGRFGKIIKKCVMIDPEDRYQTIEELYYALFGRKTRIAKYILIICLCIITGFCIFLWKQENIKTDGVKDTGRTEEINSVNVRWMELEDYNISYPCLYNMEQTDEYDIEETGIQEAWENMAGLAEVQEDIFEKQFYYKTGEGAWFSMSLVRDIDNKTGYDILEKGLKNRKDRLAYADASNTSFCYAETYNENNVIYYAGTVKNGLWFYMTVICPKDYESEYKKYTGIWRTSVKELEAVSLWQEAWEVYQGRKYVSEYETDGNIINYCLEIQTVENAEIVFSITMAVTDEAANKKLISTTGYIREYIINGTVVFTGECSGKTIRGFLLQNIDDRYITLYYDDKSITLKKEEQAKDYAKQWNY